jgi:hypothetical protein
MITYKKLLEIQMAKTRSVSNQTRNNWLIDVALLLGAIVATFTGIYFLFLPVGGYQGGRNPMYNVTILFQRQIWDNLHTWFGLLMIIAATTHIVVHWNWIANMTKRAIQELTSKERRFNTRSRFNVGINLLVGLSFLVTAITGIYLLFFPGGNHGIADPLFLFNRATWDLIHTWGAIILVVAAVLHFSIHWGWVRKVTVKIFSFPKTTVRHKIPA